MIRSRRLPLVLLNAWLADQRLPSSRARYRLRVWRENRSALASIKAEFELYIDEAFGDARRRLRRGFEDTLSPFNDPASDPAANYPSLLHRVTLQGYFGEILAVLAVEHWGAHGQTDWVVPAFLFRLHDQEFQHLELINEKLRSGETHYPDAPEERRPGRTGDDGLAFRMNAKNIITEMLTLEAKCLARNNNDRIEEAHQKLASGGPRPSGVRELVNLLSEYDTTEAKTWQEALLRLWQGGYHQVKRLDGIAYACGHSPARGQRIAWLPADKPHSAYTVRRNLEGMEFQFEEITTLIDTLFKR